MSVSPVYQAATSVGVPIGSTIETLEVFCARRARAYAVGELKARQREISADAYLFLYKELVGLAGERTYCWPGLEYLVDRLGRSEGTLKRWMKELERAGLVQRQPRPGGQTSLTYIMAYLQVDCEAEAEVRPSAHASDEPEAGPACGTSSFDISAVPDQEMLPACPAHEAIAEPPVFFVPEQQIDSDPGARSNVISHTVKKQELKDRSGSGGGDTRFAKRSAASFNESDIIQLLRDEAVYDPQAVIALQQKPLEELRAISGYLDKQTNVHSRPGLFVWLAQQDFGAKLLAGRHHKAERRKSRGRPATCAHTDPSRLTLALEREPVCADFAELWQQVLDRVSVILPKDVVDVWIKPTTLLILDNDLAVIGTPNLFVRDEVNQQYREHLETTLSDLCGRLIVLEAVIG